MSLRWVLVSAGILLTLPGPLLPLRGCLCRANRSGSDPERIVGLLRFRCRDLPRSFGESHHGCGQRTSGHHSFRVVRVMTVPTSPRRFCTYGMRDDPPVM